MEVNEVKNKLEVSIEEIAKEYDEAYNKMLETAEHFLSKQNDDIKQNPLYIIYGYMKQLSEEQADNMLKYLLTEYPGLQNMRPEVQIPLINIAISKLLYKRKKDDNEFLIMPLLKYLPMDVTVNEWLVNVTKYTIPLLVNNGIFNTVNNKEEQ